MYSKYKKTSSPIKEGGNFRQGLYFYGIFIIFGLNPVEKVRVGGGRSFINGKEWVWMNETSNDGSQAEI
jgi:hypothetical protein